MTVHVRYTLAFLLSIFLATGVCEGQDKGYNLDEDGVVNVYASGDVLSIPFGVETAMINISKGEAVVSSVKTYEDGKKFKNGVKRKIGINEIKIGNEMSNILADYETKKVIRDNEPPYDNPQRGRVDQSKSFLIVIDNPSDTKKAAKELKKLDGIRNVIPANIEYDTNFGPLEEEYIKLETDTTPNDIEENPNDPRLFDQWSLSKNNNNATQIKWAWDYLSEVNISNNDTKIAIVEPTKGGGEDRDNVKNIEEGDLETNIENIIWGDDVDSLSHHMVKVTGMAAAESDNTDFMSGAPYNAPVSLHPFFDPGDLIELDDKLEDIFNFISDYMNVDIVNISGHWDVPQDALPDAADALVDLISEGTVVVASTPNDAVDYTQQLVWGVFPHRINSLRDEKVIRVSATTKSGQLWSGASHGEILDFCGPGEDILTTDADDDDVHLNTTGSSATAPLFSATVSLMRTVASTFITTSKAFELLNQSSNYGPLECEIPNAGRAVLSAWGEGANEVPVLDGVTVPPGDTLKYNNKEVIIGHHKGSVQVDGVLKLNDTNVKVYGQIFGSGYILMDESSSVTKLREGIVDVPSTIGDEVCPGNKLPPSVAVSDTLSSDCTVSGESVIKNGATLTLTPGATLKFDDCDECELGRSQLVVEDGGGLLAEGTANQKILFKKDGSEPWGGVVVRNHDQAEVRFEHAKFTGAGDSDHEGIGPRPALLFEGGGAFIGNTVFFGNQGWAIEADQGPDRGGNSFTITNSTIKNNYKGIKAFYADATVTGTTIKNNDLTGARLWGDFVDFTNNTVTGNGFDGLQVRLNGDNAIIKNNTFTDNDGQGVSISATDVYTFENNTVKNNTGEGVSVINTSYFYADGDSKNSVLYNGSHEISSPSEFAHLYLGDASVNEGGYNDIYDTSYGSGNRYVYNGVWNDGATAPEIEAEKNNWNAEPTSGMFEGPVDYEPYVVPPLEVTVYCGPDDGSGTVTCTASATGGGGDYSYDWNFSGCDGSSTCTAPCGETNVSVTVSSANGETATASTTTSDCLGGECDNPPCPILKSPAAEAVQDAYAGVDRRTLRDRIEALTERLSGQSSRKKESPRKLYRLYDLLLLEATTEEVRRAGTGETDRTSDAPHAFSGERSATRSIFDERASKLRTSDPQALPMAERRAGKVAMKIQVQDLLRRERPKDALQKIETYRSSVNVSTQTQVGLYQLAASAYQQQGQYDEALGAINDARAAASNVSNTEARDAYLSALTPVRQGMQELARQATPKKSATTASPAKSQTSATSVDASARSLPQEFALDAPHPNPARSTATVPLALPERAYVRAAVYDVLGRRVEVLANRSFAAGRPDLQLSIGHLSGGLYLIRVKVTSTSGERHVFTEKVTVVK